MRKANIDEQLLVHARERIEELTATVMQRDKEIAQLRNTIPDAPAGFVYKCEHCGATMDHPDESEGCRYGMSCPGRTLG